MGSIPDNPNNRGSDDAGSDLRRIAQAASRVNVSNPTNLKNQHGFLDKKGRWVCYGE